MSLSTSSITSSGTLSSSNTTSSPLVFYARVIQIVPVYAGGTNPTPEGKKPNVAGLRLQVQPLDSADSSNSMSAYLPASMASAAGGTMVVPRIGEVVVCLSATPEVTFAIGSMHGYTTWTTSDSSDTDTTSTDYHFPWPIASSTSNPGTSDDAGILARGTGFRVPDQTDLQTTWNTANAPGGSPAGSTDDGTTLLDDNLFFKSGCASWGASTGDVSKSEFSSSSYGFQAVQKLLSEAQDDAYAEDSETATDESADSSLTESTSNTGLGFNEVMIRSRSASSSDGSSGSWSTSGTGGVSIYGQDFVDLWTTGSASAFAKDLLTLGAGERVVIEAGKEITLRSGRSGITITPDGILLSQNTATSMSTYLKLTGFSIDSFAINRSHAGWFDAIRGAWATFMMGPGTVSMTGLISSQMSSGASAYFAPGGASSVATVTGASIEGVTDPWATIGMALQTQLGIPINSRYIGDRKDNILPTASYGTSAATAVATFASYLTGTFLPAVASGSNMAGTTSVTCTGNNMTLSAGFMKGWKSYAPVAKGNIILQATQSVGQFGYYGPTIGVAGAQVGLSNIAKIVKYGSIGSALAYLMSKKMLSLQGTTTFLAASTLSPDSVYLSHTTNLYTNAPTNQNMAAPAAASGALAEEVRAAMVTAYAHRTHGLIAAQL